MLAKHRPQIAVVLTTIAAAMFLVPVVSSSWVETLTVDGVVDTDSVQSAILDIDPDTLNDDSGGKWITAYVEFPGQLPPGCTLASIDVASVRVRVQGEQGTVAAQLHPSEVKNHDSDPALERHFKFDRAAVSALIGPPARWVTLEVVGNAQGCQFSGSDTIWYDPPGKGGSSKQQSDDDPQLRQSAEEPAADTGTDTGDGDGDAPREPAPAEPTAPAEQPAPEPSPDTTTPSATAEPAPPATETATPDATATPEPQPELEPQTTPEPAPEQEQQPQEPTPDTTSTP